MAEELTRIIFPAIIAILIIWLVYRIKLQVKRIFKEEFFNSFPGIRETIDKLERRLQFLKSEIELLERKLNRHKNNTDSAE